MKNPKNIMLDGASFKILDAAKKRYAKELNKNNVGWSPYLKQLYELAGRALLPASDNEPVQIAALAQPAAAVVETEPEVVTPAETPEIEPIGEVKEESTVCTECDKRQARITELEGQIKEHSDAVPEDLGAVIAHCTDGSCAAHAQQWEKIKAQIVEDNKPAIIQATLENLPDAIVEAEALSRGFIPKKITIPLARR